MPTPNTNVFNDPQGGMAVLLRPPSGFETLYQGLSRATPLPFVMADSQDRFLPLDPRAGTDEISEFLARYVPVPIGATLLLLIPRARYMTDTPQETSYTYELRWRLRTVEDHNFAQGQNNPTVPYSLQSRRGAPENDGAQRVLFPGFTTEAVVPAAVGNGVLPVVSGSAADPQVGYATQGLYLPDTVGDETIAHAPNAYFAPLQRRVVGNELSVVAYRAAGEDTWDFAGDDAGISNVYGTNLGGTETHPIFPNVGMFLVFLAGSPAL